jgi:hypothetical protein
MQVSRHHRCMVKTASLSINPSSRRVLLAASTDAKYRLGVFHLESLRINVERVSQGGSNVRPT